MSVTQMEKPKEEKKLEDFDWTPGDPITIWGPNGGKVPYRTAGKERKMAILPTLSQFPKLDEDTLSKESVMHCRLLRDLTRKISSETDIDGPIGYGKSTLTSLLYQIMDVRTFYEITDSIQLELFSHDAATYGAPFQLFLMDFRNENTFKKIMALKREGISSLSDKLRKAEKMFFRTLKRYGLLEREGLFEDLDAKLDWYTERAGLPLKEGQKKISGHPDLVVLVEGSPETGHQRSLKRGRDYEVSQLYKHISDIGRERIRKAREGFLELMKRDLPQHLDWFMPMYEKAGEPSRLKQGNVTLPYLTDLNRVYKKDLESDLALSGFDGVLARVNVDNFTRSQEQLLAIANMAKYGLILSHIRKGYKIIEDRKKECMHVYSKD